MWLPGPPTCTAPATTTCALCGRPFGSRGGWWWRRRRVLALALGGVTACDLCLERARAILARTSGSGSAA